MTPRPDPVEVLMVRVVVAGEFIIAAEVWRARPYESRYIETPKNL
jgi:hypothetical protein